MQELAKNAGAEPWQILIALIGISILAYFRLGFPRPSLQLLSTPFRSVHSRDLEASEQGLVSHFTIPPILISWLSMGMLIFVLTQNGWFVFSEIAGMGYRDYLQLVSAVAVFSTSKHLLNHFWNFWIFQEPHFPQLLEKRYNTSYVSGLLLFLLLLLPWLHAPGAQLFMWFAALQFSVMYLLGLFRVVEFLRLCKQVSIYYKILYLCALEIAPVGLLYYWLSVSY